MRNYWKVVGIIVLTAIVGFAIPACSNGSTGGKVPEELITIWYLSQTSAETGINPQFEFMSNGTLYHVPTMAPYGYKVSGNTITVFVGTLEIGTGKYAISGKELTFSDRKDLFPLGPGPYYKK